MKPSDTNDVDMRPMITNEMIAARAYEIFQRRQETGAEGNAITDWQQAEEELRHERQR